MTITEFLLARVAEDEQVARAAQSPLGATIFTDPRRGGKQSMLTHIARHDPARVLAECEAKREAVEAAWSDHLRIEGEWGMRRGQAALEAEGDVPEVVTALAKVYADHPAYREEWAS